MGILYDPIKHQIRATMGPPMNFYEVTNGYMGESMVAVYVWAPDEATALEMAQAAYESDGKKNGHKPDYWTGLELKHLFCETDAPFVTTPSGSGYWIES